MKSNFENEHYQSTDFGFGLEAEYLLADKHTFDALWYHELSFKTLNQALESVSLVDIPSLDGLLPDIPHTKNTPFIVEGYHVHNSQNQAFDILPKGIEIRTPKAKSIEQCLSYLELLYMRMQCALDGIGYRAVSLSHHPTAQGFEGPIEARDYNFWLWAKQAMTTYGPDINVSLPHEITTQIDLEDLSAKVNYYAPALTALSLASPFFEGELWNPDPSSVYLGKAIRTFKRSAVAPAFKTHPDLGWRFEFKPFEMSWRLEDFHAYFLLWLELLLDDSLHGRADQQTRISQLELVAQHGLSDYSIIKTANEVLNAAAITLPRWGFRVDALKPMAARLEMQITPADEIIDLYRKKESIPLVLKELSHLIGVDARKMAPAEEFSNAILVSSGD